MSAIKHLMEEQAEADFAKEQEEAVKETETE